MEFVVFASNPGVRRRALVVNRAQALETKNKRFQNINGLNRIGFLYQVYLPDGPEDNESSSTVHDPLHAVTILW